MNLVYTLQDGTEPEIEQIGGKGLSLVRAARKGFTVPPAAILSTNFFRPWIDQIKTMPTWQAFTKATGDGILGVVKAVKKSCQTLAFSEAQQQAVSDVRKFLQSENTPLVAVRSSSPEEDLEGASFAGIYETVLGVTDSALEEAIKTCFASTLDERVVAYKQQHGYDPFDPKIAVIIQKQVVSEVSGVAFSLNPVTNSYDDCVINANFGLGETVVDGTVTPDQFTVDKVKNKILEKVTGKKDVSHHVKAGGGTETRTSAYPSVLCLTDDQVLAITSLTSHIETEYGKPMDIEWAYEEGQLYLLQARPITGYFQLPPEIITVPGKRKKLYQDGLLSEQGLVESLSPLGEGIFNLMAKVMMTSLGGDENLAERMGAVVTMGRAYTDVGKMAQLTGKKNYIKGIRMVDSLGADILENLDLKPYKKGLLPAVGLLWGLLKMGIKGLPSYLKMYLRTRKASNKPGEYLEFFLEENKGYKRDLEAEYAKNGSFETFSRIAMEKGVSYFYTISGPTTFAAELARSRIKKLFKNEPQSVQDQVVYIEQALPGNVTIEMGLLLHDLSQFPDVQQTATAGEFVQKLERQQLSAGFMEKWQLFMQQHGHRCPKEIDVSTPRYREKPDEMFRLLKTMGSSSDPDLTPPGIFENGIKKREETHLYLVDVLEKQKKGKKKVKNFQKKYRTLKTFAGYREIHKYYLIVSVDYVRSKLLALAGLWVEAGRLDSVEQVFDLKYDEVVQAEKDLDLDLRPLISTNRANYGPFKNQPNPPVLIDSRGFIPTLPRKITNENEFIGTPASPGTVKGPVKILSRPDEKPLLPGEILVTRATDPGWTPLFLNAGGVLLETGGTLQHGASVARESCKPCIVGLNNITEFLEDGQIVELDGSTGLVKLLE
ncbi:MAG: PEP/pyruvate-binding domain-containing protein [Candidatus Hodarchaeales archaeon]|jgi:pyruvate,water dikinase